MKIYIDFDDVLCETAEYFTKIAKELFGIDVPYRQVQFFNLQKSFDLNDEYMEGIFVRDEMQSQGIGKLLLNFVKEKKTKLYLNVYQKNTRAIHFYQREGFEIQREGLDEVTGEKDYVMVWQRGNSL